MTRKLVFTWACAVLLCASICVTAPLAAFAADDGGAAQDPAASDTPAAGQDATAENQVQPAGVPDDQQPAKKLTKWQKRLEKYRLDSSVKQMLLVQYLGNSKARIKLYVKKGVDTDNPVWKRALTCNGYVGRNGINKKREGDGKTPTGTFNVTMGYGIKANPGTKLKYLHVKSYHYWCGDKAHYNQLVDVRKQPHACVGEHLIEYKTAYRYGLVIDYNMNPVKYKKGSAIFIHCTYGAKNTSGCIAMSKKNMVKVLRKMEKGAKVCIYKR